MLPLRPSRLIVLLITLKMYRWLVFLPFRAKLPCPLRTISCRKFCMCPMFTDAWIASAALPSYSHKEHLFYDTWEPTSVVKCKQTHMQVGWRVPWGKLALTTVHPHTELWKAGSSTEIEWVGQLASGHLASGADGPKQSRQQRMHVRSGHMYIYRLGLLFTGDRNSWTERPGLQNKSQEGWAFSLN